MCEIGRERKVRCLPSMMKADTGPENSVSFQPAAIDAPASFLLPAPGLFVAQRIDRIGPCHLKCITGEGADRDDEGKEAGEQERRVLRSENDQGEPSRSQARRLLGGEGAPTSDVRRITITGRSGRLPSSTPSTQRCGTHQMPTGTFHLLRTLMRSGRLPREGSVCRR